MDKIFSIKSKQTKFIFSVISGSILLAGGAGLMVCGSLNVYILSYIHYKQTWVSMQYGNLIGTLLQGSLAIFSPLAGLLEKKFGPRILMIISGILSEIALICFYFQRSIWLMYMITIFTGFSCSLSFFVPVKNACFYYPKYKGTISSCMISITIFGGAAYVLIGESIINPGREGVSDPITLPF